MSCRLLLIATLAACLLQLIGLHCGFADEPEIQNNGNVSSYGLFGFDYELEGVKLTDSTWYDTSGHKDVAGDIIDPEIKISGNLNVRLDAFMLNEYTARVKASTTAVDQYGNGFGTDEYICDGPIWTWEKTFDGREVKEGYKKQVPFSLTVPVPAADPARGIDTVYFEIQLDCWQTVYAYETPERKHNYVTLRGTMRIPHEFKPQRSAAISIETGNQFEPLKVTFTLSDTTDGPPKPIEGAMISIDAPLCGSNRLGVQVPTGPGGIPIHDPPRASDIFNSDPPAENYWSLAQFFRCNTQCLNGDKSEPVTKFSAECYFRLRNPQEPIEVLTDKNGQVELEFYLDLDALGHRAPKRQQPLTVPINAEYIGFDGKTSEKYLARASRLIELKYVGFVVSVTCVEPQEFAYQGILNGWVPQPWSGVRFPLAEYYGDPGTPPPGKRVYGADRAIFTPCILVLSEDGTSTVQRETLQSRQLKRGLMISCGDEIDLNARGMVRIDPDTEGPGMAGQPGRPGWIWVKVRFFDATNAMVGINGECGTHSVTIGHSPEDSGWVPPAKSWFYTVAREAGEEAVSKLHPVLGVIDVAGDVGSFIKWFNNRNPVYIRVQSEFHVSTDSDGNSVVTVLEGQPVLLSEATGLAGMAAKPGATITVSPDNQVHVRPSEPEEIERAEVLLDEVRGFDVSGLDFDPIEVETGPVSTPPVEPAQLPDLPAQEPPTVEPTPPTVPETSSQLPVDTRTMMSVRVDNLVFELRGDWEYEPETEESFPVLTNQAIRMFMAVISVPVTTEELLKELGGEMGTASALTVAGRAAQWIPQLDEGEQSGALLCFEGPQENGEYLHVSFFSSAQAWPGLQAEVLEILEGLHFVN